VKMKERDNNLNFRTLMTNPRTERAFRAVVTVVCCFDGGENLSRQLFQFATRPYVIVEVPSTSGWIQGANYPSAHFQFNLEFKIKLLWFKMALKLTPDEKVDAGKDDDE